MSDLENHPATTGSRPVEGPSRRQVVAAGVVGGLGAVPAVFPEAAEAAGAARAATGPRGATVVEFRGRIDQTGSTGENFTSYGYLTRLTHAQRSELFDDPPHDETTALLTAFAHGDLKARVLDMSVHSLDIVGAMTIYQRAHGGADFTHPASFKVGRPVARYDLVLQDILTVFSQAHGLPTLTGDMTQTSAKGLSGALAGLTFGRRGNRLRMFATGLGQLVDPATLNAQLEIAGNWSAE